MHHKHLRDWNVDLIPKFLMANGQLVKLLVHTGKTHKTNQIKFKATGYSGQIIQKEKGKTKRSTRVDRKGKMFPKLNQCSGATNMWHHENVCRIHTQNIPRKVKSAKNVVKITMRNSSYKRIKKRKDIHLRSKYLPSLKFRTNTLAPLPCPWTSINLQTFDYFKGWCEWRCVKKKDHLFEIGLYPKY